MRELENYLYQTLISKIECLGFLWIKNSHYIIKKNRNGYFKFMIIAEDHSIESKDDIKVSLTLCVRLNDIEEIYSGYRNISQPKLLKAAATHCASWGQLHEDEKLKLTIVQRDVDNVSEKIYDIFMTEALPFFNSRSTIEELDTLYNDNSNALEISIKRISHTITLSLILAKLTKRSDYLMLVQKYEAQLKSLKYNDFPDYYPNIFNKLVKDLFE